MAMTRWERKAAMKHGDVKDIADRLGVSRPHVSQVLNDKRRDRDVEVAIARAIGKPVDEVFAAKAEAGAA